MRMPMPGRGTNGPFERWMQPLISFKRGAFVATGNGQRGFHQIQPRDLKVVEAYQNLGRFHKSARGFMVPLDYPGAELSTYNGAAPDPPLDYGANAAAFFGTVPTLQPSLGTNILYFYDPPSWPFWPPSHYRTWIGPDQKAADAANQVNPRRIVVPPMLPRYPNLDLLSNYPPEPSPRTTDFGFGGNLIFPLLMTPGGATMKYPSYMTAPFWQETESWGDICGYTLYAVDYDPPNKKWEWRWSSASTYGVTTDAEPTGASGRLLRSCVRDFASGDLVFTRMPECAQKVEMRFQAGDTGGNPFHVITWPQEIKKATMTIPGGGIARLAWLDISTQHGLTTKGVNLPISGVPQQWGLNRIIVRGGPLSAAQWLISGGALGGLYLPWAVVLEQTNPDPVVPLVVDITAILQGLAISPGRDICLCGGARYTWGVGTRYFKALPIDLYPGAAPSPFILPVCGGTLQEF